MKPKQITKFVSVSLGEEADKAGLRFDLGDTKKIRAATFPLDLSEIDELMEALQICRERITRKYEPVFDLVES